MKKYKVRFRTNEGVWYFNKKQAHNETDLMSYIVNEYLKLEWLEVKDQFWKSGCYIKSSTVIVIEIEEWEEDE